MRDFEVDVLIIGAGPAGTVAAAKLHQAGLQVMIVEKEKFPRFVIGESLLPRCMEVLEDCGLLEAVKKQNFQEKFGAKFVKGDQISDFNFQDQFSDAWNWTWQVPRADFDKTLSDEVERMGVPVHFQTTVTGITFNEDESSETTIENIDGTKSKIHAKYIVDASGYGRVIPRLFNLDKPSVLDPRKAVFAHLRDLNRHKYDEPNRIIVVLYSPATWVWIIPFSTGITSVGFVGSFDFFNNISGDLNQQFDYLIQNNAYLCERFLGVEKIFDTRKLESWSATTDKFYGHGFVLTGNVTEFLDPIFSSGVMFATVSSHVASKLVIRKMKGEPVDWDKDYTQYIQQGVDTFRSYVMGWYDGTLEKIFFAKNPDPTIKRQICSVLAGYVWDTSNPFVNMHHKLLRNVSKIIEHQEKMESLQNLGKAE